MNDISFISESVLLGFALAMDAFCVSVSNSLANPEMKASKMNLIAFSFGCFQFLMPLLGWFLVTTLLGLYNVFATCLPWVSLSVLWYLGVNMIIEGRVKKKSEAEVSKEIIISFGVLMIQSLATSVDALSAGLTFTSFSISQVLISCCIIGLITYALCMVALKIGKTVGVKLSKWAATIGGSILIIIGAWNFLG